MEARVTSVQPAAEQRWPLILLAPPLARAAYSDRTAWLMAELSRLAYKRFESNPELLENLATRLADMADQAAIKDAVAEFVKVSSEPAGSGLEALKVELASYRFDLVKTFNSRGTQGFLAKRDGDRMAVLAFRGTEQDFTDIKTDLRARFYTRNGVRVHDGFWQAYTYVRPVICQAVAQLSDYHLYITGHSLGGALALIATRDISADNVAACYTFGSPRVGDSEFGDAIKPPVYRVVNAADAVPRVPPTWLIDLVIFLAQWLPVPYVRSFLVRFLENFRGYRHYGDMRYLTDWGDHPESLRLIPNPNGFDRARWLLARLTMDWQAGFRDHAIARYCDKLKTYALQRLKA